LRAAPERRPADQQPQQQLSRADSEQQQRRNSSAATHEPRPHSSAASQSAAPTAETPAPAQSCHQEPAGREPERPLGSGGEAAELGRKRKQTQPAGGQHSKSMAQARYLYSTLTSNAGALLAAALVTQQQQTKREQEQEEQLQKREQKEELKQKQISAAASKQHSPSRPARKQAQFVTSATDRQPHAKLAISAASIAAAAPPTGVGLRAEGGRASPGARETVSGTEMSPKGRPRAGRKQPRFALAQRPRDDPSSSDSDASERGGVAAGNRPALALRAAAEGEPRAPETSPEGQEEERERGDRVGAWAPTIVESSCASLEQRRLSSQAAGRSASSEACPAGQFQLQPGAMDPEMHALWAQGADLDTGNGNFIMATRRRRSVHAIHQVQLHQQGLAGQLTGQLTGAGQLAGQPGGQSALPGTRDKLHRKRSSQLQAAAEEPRQPQWSGAQAPPVAPASTRLRDQLRKLRSSSSIDEAPRKRGRPADRLPGVSAQDQAAQEARSEPEEAAAACGARFARARRSEPLIVAEQDEELDDEEQLDSLQGHALAASGPKSATSGLGPKPEVASFAPSSAASEREFAGKFGGELDEELGEEFGEQLGEVSSEELVKEEEEEEGRLFVLADAQYDLDELESGSSMLARLYEWNYPIFELVDRYQQAILSKLSYRIFFDSGFFDSFKIPKQAFFNFFHALEQGYHDKPYHNRLHAADVLHAVYYLTSQPIDNFCQVPLDLIEHYDNLLATTKPHLVTTSQQGSQQDSQQGAQMIKDKATITPAASQLVSGEEKPAATPTTDDLRVATPPFPAITQMAAPADSPFVSQLHNHIVAVVVAAAAAAADSELPFGIMGANLTALEVMALYTAAAMHDFQHPGRTNSFLVATNSPLALLYNDRSVLENHHSAAAWALFYSGDNFNWLCNLEKDEFKRFRFMIIELILATDLMRHYELVSAFNKKLNDLGQRHNIDWFCESDRLLVMEIIIKLADVNGPMKGHQLHCQWTERIAQEFYEQGDEERALNLPVSLYMDRSDPRLPELQKSFINHLVGPLSHSYAAAGFFPRAHEGESGPVACARGGSLGETDAELAGETVYQQTKYWLIEDEEQQEGQEGQTSPSGDCGAPAKPKRKLNRQFLACTQTKNLRNNFLYWDAKSREKQSSADG